MPELPEVESVRTGLIDYVVGTTIEDAQAFGDRVVRYSESGLTGVLGHRVEGIYRRGKYLWFDLGERPLVAHLGMSGQFRLNCAGLKHVRASFSLSNGSELTFIDQRTFGHLTFDEYSDIGCGSERVPKMVAHIARDLVDPLLDQQALVETISGKRSEIKRILLDQTVVSGIGNIYADEALFRARIHPQERAHLLRGESIDLLLESACDVLEEAIRAGGTSFDALYVNVNGESGYFERSLQAYGREGKPCLRCTSPLVRAVVGGRSSHFCPKCQRLS